MKTYHIAHKPQAITLLKQARKRVAAGTVFPICYAIRSSFSQDFAKSEKRLAYSIASDDLTEWISRNLGLHAYYYSWLKAKSAKFRRANYFGQHAAVKEGRLAWIDWMISELEKLV